MYITNIKINIQDHEIRNWLSWRNTYNQTLMFVAVIFGTFIERGLMGIGTSYHCHLRMVIMIRKDTIVMAHEEGWRWGEGRLPTHCASCVWIATEYRPSGWRYCKPGETYPTNHNLLKVGFFRVLPGHHTLRDSTTNSILNPNFSWQPDDED